MLGLLKIKTNKDSIKFAVMKRKIKKTFIIILLMLSIVLLTSCVSAKDIEDARKATAPEIPTKIIVEIVSETTTTPEESPDTGN